MSYSSKKEEVEDEYEEEVPKVTSSSNIRASGYCDKCHNRYTDVPVKNGEPVCPICK